jgi:alkylation response protein AidB-like acyl-CoA dehydrogenase
MDTDATDDQRALLAVSRRFMEDACPMVAVRSGAWRDHGFAKAYRQQAARLGWFSMLVPESLGGGSLSGEGAVDAALIAYQRGAVLAPGPYVGTNVVAYVLARAGSAELRNTVLPGLLAGETSAAWAAHFPGGSMDGGVKARTLANGGLELSGTKSAVQDVDASTWLLVTCTTSDGPTQALVSADCPGVSVTELESLDISRRYSKVHFDRVQVDPAAVVGVPGSANVQIAEQLSVACTLVAAEMTGAMDHNFAMTVQYAKDRIAFGRPIGSFQGVKHQLADTSLSLELSKAVTAAAARSVAADDGYGSEAASMAKAFVSDAGVDLVQTCFQVFGGIGYTWEHDQHLYLRRITTDAGLFGDAAWHREHLCQLAGL